MCGAQHFTSWDEDIVSEIKNQGFPKVAQTTQQEKPGKILAPGAHLEHHDRLPGGWGNHSALKTMGWNGVSHGITFSTFLDIHMKMPMHFIQ